jgi:hypothetical protein
MDFVSLLVLCTFFSFFIFIIYILASTNFSKTKKSQQAIIICDNNQCATNIKNGIRRCPENGEKMAINPDIEVCNTQFICDNQVTPYALISDGSTNSDGICEEGVNCPCVNYLSCPNYISSMFTSLITPSTYTQTSINNFPQIPVTKITNPQSQFCTVPFSWLTISNPGCNFVNTFDYSNEDVLTCMNLINSCVLSEPSNPCLYGTLAFIVDNETIVNQNTIPNLLLGCVKSNPVCDCDEYSIYNTDSGEIMCSKI